jgi:hypothetical protein
MVQVPSGIITGLAHPPYQLLQRETAPALSTGLYTVTRTRGPIGVDAFGITFSFFTVPAAFGHTDTAVLNYEEPICSFAAEYKLLDGGFVLEPETMIHHEGGLYFFSGLFPNKLYVWVQVGCTVIPRFLLAL